MSSLISCGKVAYRTNLEVYCPTLKSYPEDFGMQLADELVEAEEYGVDLPLTIETIEDYQILRKKVEACKAEAGKGVN